MLYCDNSTDTRNVVKVVYQLQVRRHNLLNQQNKFQKADFSVLISSLNLIHLFLLMFKNSETEKNWNHDVYQNSPRL